VEEWNNGVADYSQNSSIPIFQSSYTHTPHGCQMYFLCIKIILDTNEIGCFLNKNTQFTLLLLLLRVIILVTTNIFCFITCN
jgi:hypothetical protein